jgi:hypothetical protein
MRDLFNDFCACFNDADHVIVADVYAAGEAPIEGFARDDFINGLIAHGHPSVSAMDNPEELGKLIIEHANPGDVVMCLGAGTITNWAAELPHQLANITGEEVLSMTALISRLPSVRGKYQTNISMAEHTWFGVGGAAEVLFTPADAEDLHTFLKALDADIPVYPVGAGSNLLVRDGGVSGVIISTKAIKHHHIEGTQLTVGSGWTRCRGGQISIAREYRWA